LKACIERGDIPADWFSAENLADLACVNTNLIKSNLEQTYADLLFLIQRKDGTRCYIHFESATTLKGDELLRLYHYKGAILTLDQEKYKKKKEGMGLPTVVQIFLYTGTKSKKAEEMAQLVRTSAQLIDGADYSLCFVPLYAHPDKTLLQNSVTGPAEVLMKHAKKRGVLSYLQENPKFAAHLGTMDYGIAAGYLAGAMEPDEEKRAQLLRILFNLRPELIKGVMCEINPAIKIIEKRGMEQGMERGMERGIEQGIEQGMERGRLEMILGMDRAGVGRDLIAKGAKCSVREVESMLVAA
jgi:hypothetical protein